MNRLNLGVGCAGPALIGSVAEPSRSLQREGGIRTSGRMLAAMLLTSVVACSDMRSTGNPSSPSRSSYELSGTVSLVVAGSSRPLPGRSVWIWVEPVGGRASSTDANGRYTTVVPPGARVFVTGYASSFEQQPCIAGVEVHDDTVLDVTVVPLGSPANPPSGTGPLITGFVFETTPQGRRPLRANIQLRLSEDNFIAFARTDEAGRFSFCRVNVPVWLDVATFEFSEGFSRWIPGVADVDLEIEFGR